MLKRFNLNTRSKRLALIARHADPYQRKPEIPPKELHIDASEPGEKVQMDCFYVGRLAGSKGVIWQYTAIEVASAYSWAFLRSQITTPPHDTRPSWSTWSPMTSRSAGDRPSLLQHRPCSHGQVDEGGVPADIVFGARKMASVR